jgi:N-acetylglucosamine kinase-like BadF-type ATPase
MPAAMTSPVRYFLGADVGGTKTHILIADESGIGVGFGAGGPGNHEGVGYDGFERALRTACDQACASAGISTGQIAGAGFGVAGYDWQSQTEAIYRSIGTLGIAAPVSAVNDSILGLLAGSAEGWGLAVVSGTGCNCWGWDRERKHIGQVTGGGSLMGEGAGGGELILKTIQALAHAWTRRGTPTCLTDIFIQRVGASGIEDFLEGIMSGRYSMDASAAPLVFQAAGQGDGVAQDLIRWAGSELGELAIAVIRQLGFESLAFDIVLLGSMFHGGNALINSMRQKVHCIAPASRLVRLLTPPVTGAVVLGMEQAGLRPSAEVRKNLVESLKHFLGRKAVA